MSPPTREERDVNLLRDLSPVERLALAEVLAERSPRKTPKRKAACGTRSGYEHHRRLGEIACGACKDAERNRSAKRWRARGST